MCVKVSKTAVLILPEKSEMGFQYLAHVKMCAFTRGIIVVESGEVAKFPILLLRNFTAHLPKFLSCFARKFPDLIKFQARKFREKFVIMS